jgi:hypothetical protein
MDLAMMAAAERHIELIADLATESALLREAQMMEIPPGGAPGRPSY